MSRRLSIESIHEYTLNHDEFRVEHKEHKVARETVNTVILENGQRLRGEDIMDFNRNNNGYSISDRLQWYNQSVFTIHEITPEEAAEVKKMLIESAKDKCSQIRNRMRYAKEQIKEFKNELIENEKLLPKYQAILRKLKGEK